MRRDRAAEVGAQQHEIPAAGARQFREEVNRIVREAVADGEHLYRRRIDGGEEWPGHRQRECKTGGE